MTPLESKRSAEAAAWCDLLTATPRLAKQLGSEVLDVDGTRVLIARNVDAPMFNRAFDARPEPRHFDRLTAVFERRWVPRYFIHVDAQACTESLTAEAEARGLVKYHRPWIELLGPGAEAAPGLATGRAASGEAEGGPGVAGVGGVPVTVRVATASDAPAIAAIFSEGFALPRDAAEAFAAAIGRPRWTVLVADVAGEVAGAGLLFVDGAVGYLAGGAVEARHRGRGVQRALVASRVEWARLRGCQWVTSQTGAAVAGEPQHSYRNLLRFGLEPVSLTEHYVPPALAAGWGRGQRMLTPLTRA